MSATCGTLPNMRPCPSRGNPRSHAVNAPPFYSNQAAVASLGRIYSHNVSAAMTLASPIVHVIVAADYGERLRSLPANEAAWVADTAANQSVIKSIWASYPVEPCRGYLTGITSFQVAADHTPEDWLLGVLDSVEEHHSEHSQTPPYSILRVIGAALSPRIRAELESYDFIKFKDSPDGFVAHKVSALDDG
jgi:hypothetical protein